MNFLTRKRKIPVKESKKKQTYLGPSTKTCSDCLMTFSIGSDMKLHDKFHSNFLNGIPLSLNGNFFQTLSDSTFKIVKIINYFSLPKNHKVFEILNIVDNSLGVDYQENNQNLIVYF